MFFVKPFVTKTDFLVKKRKIKEKKSAKQQDPLLYLQYRLLTFGCRCCIIK